MLALTAGPAVDARAADRADGALAALAALTVTVPALVYGYELIASVKEITATAMIFTLGALVTLHSRWLRGPPRSALPFALVAAAGVSTLGVAFGRVAFTAVVVLAGDRDPPDRGESAERTASRSCSRRPEWPSLSSRHWGTLARSVRVAAVAKKHRINEQSWEPAKTAPLDTGARDVAGGQLQARSNWRPTWALLRAPRSSR